MILILTTLLAAKTLADASYPTCTCENFQPTPGEKYWCQYSRDGTCQATNCKDEKCLTEGLINNVFGPCISPALSLNIFGGVCVGGTTSADSGSKSGSSKVNLALAAVGPLDRMGCVIGNSPDDNYFWCSAFKQCILPTETQCPLGGLLDHNGCAPSTGYSWNSVYKKCMFLGGPTAEHHHGPVKPTTGNLAGPPQVKAVKYCLSLAKWIPVGDDCPAVGPVGPVMKWCASLGKQIFYGSECPSSDMLMMAMEHQGQDAGTVYYCNTLGLFLPVGARCLGAGSYTKESTGASPFCEHADCMLHLSVIDDIFTPDDSSEDDTCFCTWLGKFIPCNEKCIIVNGGVGPIMNKWCASLGKMIPATTSCPEEHDASIVAVVKDHRDCSGKANLCSSYCPSLGMYILNTLQCPVYGPVGPVLKKNCHGKMIAATEDCPSVTTSNLVDDDGMDYCPSLGVRIPIGDQCPPFGPVGPVFFKNCNGKMIPVTDDCPSVTTSNLQENDDDTYFCPAWGVRLPKNERCPSFGPGPILQKLKNCNGKMIPATDDCPSVTTLNLRVHNGGLGMYFCASLGMRIPINEVCPPSGPVGPVLKKNCNGKMIPVADDCPSVTTSNIVNVDGGDDTYYCASLGVWLPKNERCSPFGPVGPVLKKYCSSLGKMIGATEDCPPEADNIVAAALLYCANLCKWISAGEDCPKGFPIGMKTCPDGKNVQINCPCPGDNKPNRPGLPGTIGTRWCPNSRTWVPANEVCPDEVVSDFHAIEPVQDAKFCASLCKWIPAGAFCSKVFPLGVKTCPDGKYVQINCPCPSDKAKPNRPGLPGTIGIRWCTNSRTWVPANEVCPDNDVVGNFHAINDVVGDFHAIEPVNKGTVYCASECKWIPEGAYCSPNIAIGSIYCPKSNTWVQITCSCPEDHPDAPALSLMSTDGQRMSKVYRDWLHGQVLMSTEEGELDAPVGNFNAIGEKFCESLQKWIHITAPCPVSTPYYCKSLQKWMTTGDCPPNVPDTGASDTGDFHAIGEKFCDGLNKWIHITADCPGPVSTPYYCESLNKWTTGSCPEVVATPYYCKSLQKWTTGSCPGVVAASLVAAAQKNSGGPVAIGSYYCKTLGEWLDFSQKCPIHTAIGSYYCKTLKAWRTFGQECPTSDNSAQGSDDALLVAAQKNSYDQIYCMTSGKWLNPGEECICVAIGSYFCKSSGMQLNFCQKCSDDKGADDALLVAAQKNGDPVAIGSYYCKSLNKWVDFSEECPCAALGSYYCKSLKQVVNMCQTCPPPSDDDASEGSDEDDLLVAAQKNGGPIAIGSYFCESLKEWIAFSSNKYCPPTSDLATKNGKQGFYCESLKEWIPFNSDKKCRAPIIPIGSYYCKSLKVWIAFSDSKKCPPSSDDSNLQLVVVPCITTPYGRWCPKNASPKDTLLVAIDQNDHDESKCKSAKEWFCGAKGKMIPTTERCIGKYESTVVYYCPCLGYEVGLDTYCPLHGKYPGGPGLPNSDASIVAKVVQKDDDEDKCKVAKEWFCYTKQKMIPTTEWCPTEAIGSIYCPCLGYGVTFGTYCPNFSNNEDDASLVAPSINDSASLIEAMNDNGCKVAEEWYCASQQKMIPTSEKCPTFAIGSSYCKCLDKWVTLDTYCPF